MALETDYEKGLKDMNILISYCEFANIFLTKMICSSFNYLTRYTCTLVHLLLYLLIHFANKLVLQQVY